MFEQIGAFFTSVINGAFNFNVIGEFVKTHFTGMAANPSIANLWSQITNAISSFSMFVPFALILLALIEVFFGKKILGFANFLMFGVIGYCVGVYSVAPLVAKIFPMLPDYISGIVIAVVVAVLSKFIYVLGYVIAAGYSGYLLSYNGMVGFVASFTKANLLVSAGVAATFILLALILRKYIEMFGTAALGGFFISKIIIANFFDYRTLAFLGNFGWVAELAVILVIALIGFIVQYKTRRRY